MSSPLKTYRVYCFDALQNMLVADSIDAADDEQAIHIARRRGFGTKCELWDGRRLIAALAGEERRQA